MSKYHAKKIKTPDGVFDSKREYKRFLELRTLVSLGEIQNLNRQVKFELIPATKLITPRRQKGRMQKSERAVTYIADFVYQKNGETVVEDVKGVRTPEYIIKRKLMLYELGIQIQEV